MAIEVVSTQTNPLIARLELTKTVIYGAFGHEELSDMSRYMTFRTLKQTHLIMVDWEKLLVS